MKLPGVITLIIMVSIPSFAVFAKNDKGAANQLPPGLQKNAKRGKPLPPGWQKKLVKGEVMEKAVFEQSKIVVPIDDKGLITISIEGKLVRLHNATREIIEILK